MGTRQGDDEKVGGDEGTGGMEDHDGGGRERGGLCNV